MDGGLAGLQNMRTLRLKVCRKIKCRPRLDQAGKILCQPWFSHQNLSGLIIDSSRIFAMHRNVEHAQKAKVYHRHMQTCTSDKPSNLQLAQASDLTLAYSLLNTKTMFDYRGLTPSVSPAHLLEISATHTHIQHHLPVENSRQRGLFQRTGI